MKKKIICIIPARKNSKRLKGKNYKMFFKKPLVYWTLKFSTKLKNVDKIIFSSDSHELLNIAKPFKKIKRFLRPKKFATDGALMKDVVLNVLNKNDKKFFSGILLLQPTTPYRNLKKFNKYLSKFNKKNDNYYSVSSKIKSNHKCYIKNKKLYFRKVGRTCFQTGSLILVSMKSFLKSNSFNINNSKPVISNTLYENFDIDYEKNFNDSLNFFKTKKICLNYFKALN